VPADPIDYRIWRHVQTALQAIRQANGYHHDVEADFALKLDPDVDVESLIAPGGPRPFGLIELGEETWVFDEKGGNAGIVMIASPFTIHFVGESDPTTDESRLLEHFKACADVEQATAAETTRTNLGTLGAWLTIARRRMSGAGVVVWSSIDGVVRRRHEFGRPNG
jgi:hypothetical protein